MAYKEEINTTGVLGGAKIKEQGRGILILVLGILSIVTLGPILGIPAWIMGKKDLKRIDLQLIDPSERSNTKAGMILGIIGTFLYAGIILLGILTVVAINMMSV